MLRHALSQKKQVNYYGQKVTVKWAKTLTIIPKMVNLSERANSMLFKESIVSMETCHREKAKKTLFCPFHRLKEHFRSGWIWIHKVPSVRVLMAKSNRSAHLRDKQEILQFISP